MSKQRPSKQETYFKIAKDLAERSPCLSDLRRGFGAILVKDDAIISTGYAGSVRGALNCGIDCECTKDLYHEAPYLSYTHCCSIHSEMNCIVNAARTGTSVVGSTLYIEEARGRGDRPCFLCRRFMIQAGILDCYYKTPDGVVHHEFVADWVQLENDWIKAQIENAPVKECQTQ